MRLSQDSAEVIAVALTTVLVMIDGFDPEYLASSPIANLRQLAKHGLMTEAKAMMPTVTNVNNVSLVTASYPAAHGITSNYWLNREDGKEHYMESSEFILAESMFQRATKQGARSLLVTAKDKLRKLLGEGTTLSVTKTQNFDFVLLLYGGTEDLGRVFWSVETAADATNENARVLRADAVILPDDHLGH